MAVCVCVCVCARERVFCLRVLFVCNPCTALMLCKAPLSHHFRPVLSELVWSPVWTRYVQLVIVLELISLGRLSLALFLSLSSLAVVCYQIFFNVL